MSLWEKKTRSWRFLKWTWVIGILCKSRNLMLVSRLRSAVFMCVSCRCVIVWCATCLVYDWSWLKRNDAGYSEQERKLTVSKPSAMPVWIYLLNLLSMSFCKACYCSSHHKNSQCCNINSPRSVSQTVLCWVLEFERTGPGKSLKSPCIIIKVWILLISL